jgi:hypothetical protein
MHYILGFNIKIWYFFFIYHLTWFNKILILNTTRIRILKFKRKSILRQIEANSVFRQNWELSEIIFLWDSAAITKITEFDVASLINKYVLRFDVSVHNIGRMDIFGCTKHIIQQSLKIFILSTVYHFVFHCLL